MEFKNIEKIKKSVETFDDAKFFSLNEDNKIIIQNIKDKSLWQIGFLESEGVIVFDTEDAEMIQEGEVDKKTAFIEKAQMLMSTLQGIFSEDEEKSTESINTVKKYFGDSEMFPVVDKEELFKEETEVKEKNTLSSIGSLPEVKSIYESFNEKIKEYEKLEKEFLENGKLFNEDNEIKKGKIFDPVLVLEAADGKNKAQEKFFENTQAIIDFKERLDEEFESEIAEFIFDHIDLTKDSKIAITSALVKARTKFNTEEEEIIDLNESLEIIKNAYKESFDGKNISLYAENTHASVDGAVPFVYNKVPSDSPFKFLKFKIGIFTNEDLNKLDKELGSAMGRLGDLEPEDLKVINEMRTKVTYMQRTNQINDSIVESIIKEFNGRFSTDPSYADPTKQGGFKSASERDSRNFNFGSVKLS